MRRLEAIQIVRVSELASHAATMARDAFENVGDGARDLVGPLYPRIGARCSEGRLPVPGEYGQSADSNSYDYECQGCPAWGTKDY